MSTYVGGLRARLIRESFFRMIRDSLDELNWLVTDEWFRPVTVRSKPVDDDEEIMPNVVAVTDGDATDAELEMGSKLTEFRMPYYVDVYAQSQAVGQHLAYDIRDLLQGRFPSIGRDRPSFTVMDYSLATPVELFNCDLEFVEVSRAQVWNKEHEKYWYAVYCEIVDNYGDEDD